MILVDAQQVAASRPGKPLFGGLSMTLSTGDRLGVVGVNGCGKSTLLRVLADIEQPEKGAVRRGRDVRVAVLDQEAVLPSGTARQVVEAAAGEARWEAAAVLDRLGLGAVVDTPVDRLSGGQAKRVALARTLVAESDLLVLDEPTNHLDVDAIRWLEDRLAEFRGGLVLVTHDRHVLDRVTNRVLELDAGKAFVVDGGYDAYLAARAQRVEQAAVADAARRNLARTELAWLRRGAPARTRKSKAHVERALAVIEAEPERSDATRSTTGAAFSAVGVDGGVAAKGWAASRHPDTPRLGDKVLEVTGLGVRHGDGPWLVRHLDLLLDPRERLGVVGPNGGGKTTLLDVFAGERAPGEGAVVAGPTARLGYYHQRGPQFDPDQSVLAALAGPAREPDHRDRALAERFWFGPDAQRAPVRLLSGGERCRLQLLSVLASRPNVLLLDEPTNDLDLDTLRLLEDFLEDWPGALVAVSHDRAFLERTVTDVLVLDGVGTAQRAPGGYAAWEADRRAAPSTGSAPARGRSRAEAAPADRLTGRPAGPAGRSPSTLRNLLREAEKALARAERDRDRCEADLAAAGVDHAALAAAGAALSAALAAVADAEQRWLELAEEAEAANAARGSSRRA